MHGRMWVRSRGSARLQTGATATLAPDDLARGLETFHEQLLFHIRGECDREVEAERRRLQQRDRIQREKKVEALAGLASVLDPCDTIPRGPSPLLRAAAAAA